MGLIELRSTTHGVQTEKNLFTVERKQEAFHVLEDIASSFKNYLWL
jgi:hypothetical protein